jgi:hypothetical protein
MKWQQETTFFVNQRLTGDIFVALESMLIEVAIVFLSNDSPVLRRPTFKGYNRISYSLVVNQAEPPPISSLYRYAKNIHHTGYRCFTQYCIVLYDFFM